MAQIPQTGDHVTAGSELKRARERAGLSAAELSERTKIQLRTINALEQSDYQRLPHGIYLKGIIRAYAREVGIDSGPILESVSRDRESLDEPEAPFAKTTESPPRREPESGHRRFATSLLIVVMMAAAAVAVVVLRGIRSTEEASTPPMLLEAAAAPAPAIATAEQQAAAMRILPVAAEASPLNAPPVVQAAPVEPAAPLATHVTSPYKGHLKIDSEPQGATVLINQRIVGTTPLDLPDYPAASYAIWVEQDGYEKWTSGVLVPANKITSLKVALEKIRPRPTTSQE